MQFCYLLNQYFLSSGYFASNEKIYLVDQYMRTGQ